MSALQRAAELDRRNWQNQLGLAEINIFLHRPQEALAAANRGLALKSNLNVFEYKVLSYLEAGDLAGARMAVSAPPKDMDMTAIVAEVSSSNNSWVLSEEQKNLLFRLTPTAFDNEKSDWALSLADALWLGGDIARARKYAEEAQAAYQERIKKTPAEPILRAYRAYALAILGPSDEAVSEANRAMALPADATTRGRIIRWLAQAYAVAGDQQRAIATIEQVLKAETWLTPAFLRIDPHYASLRGNPRFQKLMQ